jgi:hypothetical protein
VARRQHPFLSRLEFFLLGLLLLAPACLEYEERVSIDADGSVAARVRFGSPEWLPLPEGAEYLFFPTAATALAGHFGAPVKIARVGGGDSIAFEIRLPEVNRLDSPLVRHHYQTEGDEFFYRVSVQVPPGFAAAVSEEVVRRTPYVPGLSPSRRERLQRVSFEQARFTFEATFPGEVTAASGQVSARTVTWFVPITHFLDADHAELWAAGRLTQRDGSRKRPRSDRQAEPSSH